MPGRTLAADAACIAKSGTFFRFGCLFGDFAVVPERCAFLLMSLGKYRRPGTLTITTCLGSLSPNRRMVRHCIKDRMCGVPSSFGAVNQGQAGTPIEYSHSGSQ